MMEYRTIAAFVYDFDGTLAEGNIQENSFIPEIGMSKEEFWGEVKRQRIEQDADQILLYMQLMIKKVSGRITKKALHNHGKSAKLFPGLKDGSWFRRMNDFSGHRGVRLEHYIVSSGIKEMILGCPISHHFKHIFASSFAYEGENAVWPAVCINYTTKTQYLFRINKGILNSWDDEALNSYMPYAKRRIPYPNIVFIGDGDTDVPTMKMTTYQGGTAVAVYEAGERGSEKVHSLISNGRVDFTAPADYQEGTSLDIICRGIIGRIARKHGYEPPSTIEHQKRYPRE